MKKIILSLSLILSFNMYAITFKLPSHDIKLNNMTDKILSKGNIDVALRCIQPPFMGPSEGELIKETVKQYPFTIDSYGNITIPAQKIFCLKTSPIYMKVEMEFNFTFNDSEVTATLFAVGMENKKDQLKAYYQTVRQLSLFRIPEYKFNVTLQPDRSYKFTLAIHLFKGDRQFSLMSASYKIKNEEQKKFSLPKKGKRVAAFFHNSNIDENPRVNKSLSVYSGFYDEQFDIRLYDPLPTEWTNLNL